MTDARSPRIASLDVYRGVVVLCMVLAFVPGDDRPIFESLQPAHGLGWTGVDLIAPAFLFIAGVAIAVSARTWGPWRQILRRASLLWIVGVALTLGHGAFRDWSFVIAPLPRLAIAYLGGVVIFRQIASHTNGMRLQAAAGASVAALVLHWAAWRWWGSAPGGAASLLTALAMTLAGAAAGVALRRVSHEVERVAGLIVAGGFIMAMAIGWDQRWLISARVGSGSFALLAIGAATIGLAACHWFVDVRGRGRTGVLAAMGRNALPIFVLVSLIRLALPYAPAIPALSRLMSPEWASLAEGVATLAAAAGAAVWSARRGLFVRA